MTQNLSQQVENVTQEVTAVTAKAESWLKQHERIVLVAMLLIFSFFVLDKGLGIVSRYEVHKAQEATAVLAAQKAKNDLDLAQAKSMLADYQSALIASTHEIAALTASQARRNQQVTQQQQDDAHMQPSKLAERWQGLVNDTGIQATSLGFSLTNSAALATIEKVEQIAPLQQDLADEQAKTKSLQETVDKGNDLIAKGKVVVNGLQLQLTDKDKECTASLNAEKSKARVGKLKAFGIGYVSGILTGIVLHFW